MQALIAVLGIVVAVSALYIALYSIVAPIWLIVDAIKQKEKSDGFKIIWILLAIFTGPLAALIYAFCGAEGLAYKKVSKIAIFSILSVIIAGILLVVFSAGAAA